MSREVFEFQWDADRDAYLVQDGLDTSQALCGAGAAQVFGLRRPPKRLRVKVATKNPRRSGWVQVKNLDDGFWFYARGTEWATFLWAAQKLRILPPVFWVKRLKRGEK